MIEAKDAGLAAVLKYTSLRNREKIEDTLFRVKHYGGKRMRLPKWLLPQLSDTALECELGWWRRQRARCLKNMQRRRLWVAQGGRSITRHSPYTIRQESPGMLGLWTRGAERSRRGYEHASDMIAHIEMVRIMRGTEAALVEPTAVTLEPVAAS